MLHFLLNSALRMGNNYLGWCQINNFCKAVKMDLTIILTNSSDTALIITNHRVVENSDSMDFMNNSISTE